MTKETDKPKSFVAMCFDSRLQSIYQKVVRPVLDGHGFACVRGDEILVPGVVIDQVREEIDSAALVFCDLSFQNPNVFYELGVAHTLNKPTLLISQSASGIPFDVAHMRVIAYEDSKIGLLDLREQLVKALNKIAPIDPDKRIPRTDRPEPISTHQVEEIEVQRSALYSSNPELIRYAVRYLGENRDKPSFRRIQQIAETGYSPADLVRDSLSALHLIDPGEALQTIVDATFRNPDYLVRERAVTLLGSYRPDTELSQYSSQYYLKRDKGTLLDALQHRLSDESWGVRRTVCEVMGRWGDRRAIPTLMGAMSDSVAEVSLGAKEARARIARGASDAAAKGAAPEATRGMSA